MAKLTKHDLYYLLGYGFHDFTEEDGDFLLKKRIPDWIVSHIATNWGIGRLKTPAGRSWIHVTNEDVAKFLGENGVLTPKRYLPAILDEYAWSFMAGYFDAYGEFSIKGQNARVFIQSQVPGVVDFFAKHWKIQTHYRDKVLANGYKALDICGAMYKDASDNVLSISSHFRAFWRALNNQEHFDNQPFECMKLHPNALEPVKSRVTDSGYDLHIVELSKLYTTPWGAQVYKGKTQLAIKPIFGYAFDINGRSSLPDKGWSLLQGTGICDRSYTGGIEATLLKLNDEPLPKMPWKALQIVPRRAPIHANWEVRKELGESDRGPGGFGSSD